MNERNVVALRRELTPTLTALDRRGFLRFTGALALAGVLPAGCGGVPTGLAPPPDFALAVLTPRTWAVFNAASARLLGPSAAAGIAAGTLAPARAADATLARTPELAGLVSQALLALEFGVFPFVPKLRPFTALAPADQDGVLASLQRSRWALKRSLYRGVKSLACLAFYGADDGAAVAGYPGAFGGDIGIEAAFGYRVEDEPPAPR